MWLKECGTQCSGKSGQIALQGEEKEQGEVWGSLYSSNSLHYREDQLVLGIFYSHHSRTTFKKEETQCRNILWTASFKIFLFGINKFLLMKLAFRLQVLLTGYWHQFEKYEIMKVKIMKRTCVGIISSSVILMSNVLLLLYLITMFFYPPLDKYCLFKLEYKEVSLCC